MAGRRKGEGGHGENVPLWLLTYGDMITLIFTFFVLLVAMSKFDVRRSRLTMESLSDTLGMGVTSPGLPGSASMRRPAASGPMEDAASYEALREQLWDDSDDIRFESNKVVEIVSVNADMLFSPGRAELSETGRRIIETALPYFMASAHPVLIAGHAAPALDEGGASGPDPSLDPSWRLSLERALSVYRLLIDRGLDPAKLLVEAYGRFRPRYSLSSAKEMAKNRRVDFVVDKRRPVEAPLLPRQSLEREERRPADSIEYRGFIFEVPKAPPAGF